MASKVSVELVDDTDPTQKATGNIQFGLDGVHYEIDLSDANAEKLRADLNKWISCARKTHGRRTRRSSSPRRPSTTGENLEEVRAWAQKNGHKVAARGRISNTVIEAYKADKQTLAPKTRVKKNAAPVFSEA